MSEKKKKNIKKGEEKEGGDGKDEEEDNVGLTLVIFHYLALEKLIAGVTCISGGRRRKERRA